ncbi:MAG: Protein lysine acetyltransferase Pat (EC [uncultured Paraburkholderia sp.]|nr:MAG: Protein lysine acetyltransferase Pat (EC [uncultured Paraburkholderia sp.]
MTVRNLDALFRPKSVAVIGASERPGSTGAMVWARLRRPAVACESAIRHAGRPRGDP